MISKNIISFDITLFLSGLPICVETEDYIFGKYGSLQPVVVPCGNSGVALPIVLAQHLFHIDLICFISSQKEIHCFSPLLSDFGDNHFCLIQLLYENLQDFYSPSIILSRRKNYVWISRKITFINLTQKS